MLKKALARLYGGFVDRRNTAYSAGRKTISKVRVPVISVGNISAGGTGKTPFVQMLVRELLAMGHRPAIVSRGYKRKSRGEVMVSDNRRILSTVQEAGDELFLHALNLPVPVIANEDKTRGAMTAASEFDIDVIVLDDGFQHRRLHRDLDIVLIDSETVGHPFLLPLGRLREPLNSLRRAGVVCAMNGADISRIGEENFEKNCLAITALSRPGSLYRLQKRGACPEPDLSGGLLAVSAIAKPERFIRTLQEKRLPVRQSLEYRDHHWFSRSDLRVMLRECRKHGLRCIVTTEKDAVKLREFARDFEEEGISVCILPITTEIMQGREEFLKKIESIFLK